MKLKPAVLHIITRLDLGGAQKSCLALIKELQTQYPDLEVYLLTGTTGPLVSETQGLKNVILLPTLVWEIKPQNLALEIKNFYAIWQIIRQLKQQHKVLTVHTHTIKAGVVGRWAALFAGVQTRIHTIHGYPFHPYQNKLIWLTFYLCELITSLITTKFICVSQADLAAGIELFPGFKRKSSLIRAATTQSESIATQSTISFKPIKAPFTIGTIANLKPGKNLFDLLKAFKLANQTCPNLKLEIIGDGPLRTALNDQIKALGLTNQVQLIGTHPQPLTFLPNWQIFAFTSLWEGLPCAVVEAQSLGIPILAYQVGGIADLVAPERLYAPGSWSKLGRGIQSLCLHQNLNHPKGLPDDFQITKMALDHVNLYQSPPL